MQQARDGETIYKGHRSYELMRDLQRGITFSIARAGREAAAYPNPPPEDFTKIVRFSSNLHSATILGLPASSSASHVPCDKHPTSFCFVYANLFSRHPLGGSQASACLVGHSETSWLPVLRTKCLLQHINAQESADSIST